MNPREFESLVKDADYEGRFSFSKSNGEHLTKYFGGYHAICLNQPSCNPDRMGALTDNNHAIEGFSSLGLLVDFLDQAYPAHKLEKHHTRWAAPLD